MSPIVFILSPGSDPASDLMKLAERIEFGNNKIKFLSMGQGQEKVSIFIIMIMLIVKKINRLLKIKSDNFLHLLMVTVSLLIH